MTFTTFVDRNAEWIGQPQRVFRQDASRSLAPRVWIIYVEGNQIVTQWGQQGGAMQLARETLQGVNQGKKNELSPEKYAVERAKEACRKKYWEGYREVDQEGNFLDGPSQSAITDFSKLPLNLCFYKPKNNIETDAKALAKKLLAGEAWYTRKRNGLAFVLTRGSERPMLYSRKMLRQHDDEAGTQLTWDDRFPHIIEAAAQVMPPDTILLGELVMDRNGKDDFKHIQSLTKSLTAQSLEDQAKNGYPSFYIWDVAYMRRLPLVYEAPVNVRYAAVCYLVNEHMKKYSTPVLLPIDVYNKEVFQTPADALTYAKEQGWEGFVVVDPDGVYGDKAFNFKGKPDRPPTCAKLKPEYEDDFVAYWDPSKGWGEQSTKERYGCGIKSVSLWQYNKKGQLVPISNVSSGMSEVMKTSLARPALWPQVWRVVYTDRSYQSDGDDTDALTFARIDTSIDSPNYYLRHDKKPEECINERL